MIKNRAKEIYDKYKEKKDGQVAGDEPVIAFLLSTAFPGVIPVTGLCFTQNGSKRHWWVELNGEIIDPMGDDLIQEEINVRMVLSRGMSVLFEEICQNRWYAHVAAQIHNVAFHSLMDAF